MIRFAICDDFAEDREFVRKVLTAYFYKRNERIEITEYEEGTVLLDDYADGDTVCFDAIFLDIFMRKSHGMKVAEQLRLYDKNVSIILITTTDEFALAGYGVHAYSYLLKPIESETLVELLDGFVRFFHADRKESLLVKNGTTQERIRYNDIVYLESQTPYVYIHLRDGAVHRISAKLTDVEEELKGRSFTRCHQSFIVNFENVVKVDKVFHMEDGTQVPIRRQEMKAMKEAYYQYVIKTTL